MGTDLARRAPARPDALTLTLAPRVARSLARFDGAYAFDQAIGIWNTAAVTSMAYMFFYATAFDKDIGNWDTAAVTDMSNMFESATAFNQDLQTWAVPVGMSCTNFATGATAWLTAYGVSIKTTPPLSASMVAAGCGP